MSLGFIAVVAVALVLAGNASAAYYIDVGGLAGSPFAISPVSFSTGSYTYVDIRSGGGTLNQTGGAVSGWLRLGYANQDPTGSSDIYNISGGTYTGDCKIGQDGGTFTGSGIHATLNISGTGSVTVNSADMQLGGGGAGVTATLNVSDSGVFNANAPGSASRWQNNGYVNVTGGNASVGFRNVYFGGGEKIGGMTFTLNNSNPSKFISAIVDTASDYNFDLSHTGVTGDAGKILIVAPYGLVTIGQTFDLLKISAAKDILLPADPNTLLNASDAGLFSLALVTNVGGYDILQATALTPEPATMALLAIGGLGMLIRRRRKS
jgi:hypothetical protein